MTDKKQAHQLLPSAWLMEECHCSCKVIVDVNLLLLPVEYFVACGGLGDASSMECFVGGSLEEKSSEIEDMFAIVEL
ncbi:hypothetical protein F3Y22_tig00117005pilonHSYRG00316 [Hibiscus syriacus]|uniref:Uncharacterized protein n=1 Tax=Hibiscus syriacus TaxID=106335 RepID=A0A6A2XIM7_HIBSY|nr:hypothetical protein F3Y22_tig00117005pilonHSYRG00316 [Hibiscus syriacus]